MPVSANNSSVGIFSAVYIPIAFSIQNVGNESFMSREFVQRAIRII